LNRKERKGRRDIRDIEFYAKRARLNLEKLEKMAAEWQS